MTGARPGWWFLLLLVACAALLGCRKKESEQGGNEPAVTLTPNVKPGVNPNNPLQGIPSSPIKATTSLGKTPLSELEEPVPMWDFTIRVPKGLKMKYENKKTAEEPNLMYFYQWSPPRAELCQVNVNKWPTTETNPLVRVAGGKMKSDPGDKIQYDTIHLPQPVEINGLNGARYWRLFPEMYGQVELHVVYYFLLDGWGYHFNCICFGKTEAEAKKNAELADVSVCTFRKR
jgi:hypothetical protein